MKGIKRPTLGPHSRIVSKPPTALCDCTCEELEALLAKAVASRRSGAHTMGPASIPMLKAEINKRRSFAHLQRPK